MTRAVSFCALLLLLATPILLSSCQQTCQPYPTERPASVRLFDAVPDLPAIKVYIDGKLFDSAFYDLNRYPDATLDPLNTFGYRSQFRADGSQLAVGKHHIVAISDLTPADTLSDTTMLLSDHRQTLLYFGRHSLNASQPIRMIYLDDNARTADESKTLARFIDVVPDLPALDVYFSQDAKVDSNGVPKPDLQLSYGQISDENGGGTGTGRLPSDYVSIPTNGSTTGLLITAHGDTTRKIIRIPYSFATKGFFATIIVRGEARPVGTEPLVSSTVLEDGSESQGTYNFAVPSFDMRLMNATRADSLSVLIKGWNDGGLRTDVASQQNLFNIHEDSISEYMPLTPYYHGDATFWLATLPRPEDTVFRAHYVSTDNFRYTMVGLDRTKLNSGPPKYDAIRLLDTVAAPPVSSGMSRVRFVNTSPDYVANFTFEGKQYSLQQGDVAFADAPIGMNSLQVSDGSGSASVTFQLLPGQPATVYFLPSRPRVAYPYTVVQN